MREERQADAGSSHVGSPARRDSSRISSFREIHFVERAADAELARRLAAGPIVAAIVGVVAVDDDRVTGRGDSRQVGIQLVLAEVAAVGWIRPVLLAIDFVRVDDFVLQARTARRCRSRAGDDARDSWGCRR